MKHSGSTTKAGVVLRAQLVRIGTEVFAIYGDEEHGFAVDPEDFSSAVPNSFRYYSLDELYFALVNLSAAPEGRA